MAFYIITVTLLTQTAPQDALANKADGTVKLRNVMMILAKLTQTDTSTLLMALHMITKEAVNMC